MYQIDVQNSQRHAIDQVPFAHVFGPLNGAGEAVWLVIAAAARLVACGCRLLARRYQHYRAQQDYARLLEQPDHLLADIGLTREQIHAVVGRPLKLAGLARPSFDSTAEPARRTPVRAA